MELFHCSPNAEIKIKKSGGRFDTFLFFGSSASHGGDHTFKIEIDDEEIIDCKSFFYRDDSDLLDDLVAEVMDLANCDEDQAQEYLSQRDHHGDAEIDFDIQTLTAKAARVLGFRGVEVPDEHGTSWMIDMYAREADLIKVPHE